MFCDLATMRLLLVLTIVLMAAAANVYAGDLGSISQETWKCVIDAVRANPDLQDKVKGCIGQGGDVSACFQQIPGISNCFV